MQGLPSSLATCTQAAKQHACQTSCFANEKPPGALRPELFQCPNGIQLSLFETFCSRPSSGVLCHLQVGIVWHPTISHEDCQHVFISGTVAAAPQHAAPVVDGRRRKRRFAHDVWNVGSRLVGHLCFCATGWEGHARASSNMSGLCLRCAKPAP